MHDIRNTWYGCVKCSEGCEHCYMYFLDKQRDKNSAEIYRTKTAFDYPLQKNRSGAFKIQIGEPPLAFRFIEIFGVKPCRSTPNTSITHAP